MFSVRARSRMMARGPGIRSLLLFFGDSLDESLRDLAARRAQAWSIVRFSAIATIATVAVATMLYARAQDRLAFAAASLAGGAFWTGWLLLHTRLLPAGRVGIANFLTVLRFLWIAPVAVLFAWGEYVPGVVLYLLLGLTDVLDGIIARARVETSAFGAVMDPIADVLSTLAVFTVFAVQGVIPAWLYTILVVRYVMLFVGSFALFLALGPFEIRATIPGKIVGVLQAAGVVAIVAIKAFDRGADILPFIFPFLGVCFGSIVVSQLVIGILLLRRDRGTQKGVGVGSQG